MQNFPAVILSRHLKKFGDTLDFSFKCALWFTKLLLQKAIAGRKQFGQFFTRHLNYSAGLEPTVPTTGNALNSYFAIYEYRMLI